MRRWTDDEVAEMQRDVAADSAVGDMWRSVIRHAECEGGAVAQVLMGLHGPLWGDPYVRSQAAVAFMLDLPLREVRDIINGTPYQPRDAADKACPATRPEWYVNLTAAEESMLEVARRERWTVEQVDDAALHLCEEHLPQPAQ